MINRFVSIALWILLFGGGALSDQKVGERFACPNLHIGAPYDMKNFDPQWEGATKNTVNITENDIESGKLKPAIGLLADSFPDKIHYFLIEIDNYNSIILIISTKGGRVMAYHCGLIVSP